MHIARIALAVGMVLAACGTSTPAGVCCPILGSAPCNCAGGGGWAASADECSNVTTCDAWFESTIDSHDCPALAVNPSKCCGCAADAGSDAATDAPTADVTAE